MSFKHYFKLALSVIVTGEIVSGPDYGSDGGDGLENVNENGEIDGEENNYGSGHDGSDIGNVNGNGCDDGANANSHGTDFATENAWKNL